MKDIKIIFFDIDGTLIDFEHRVISERTLETLIKLQQNGIKICIATGRSPMQAPKFEGVNFDAWITYNGSLCFDDEEIIFNNPLNQSDVLTINENVKTIGRPVAVATNNRLAANGSDEDLEEYYRFGGLPLVIADDYNQLIHSEDIYQMMISCHKSDYDTILKGVKQARITAWWDRAVDIIPKDGGKGTAISEVLAYYHLRPEQALAFGDGDNDIEMLQTVGKGIAMGNASKELKAIADDMCESVANDGIYHYCIEHGLI